MNVRTLTPAFEVNSLQRHAREIASQGFAVDWATLGAMVLEAATMTSARHAAVRAQRLAINGSVVEPPTMRPAPRV